MAEHFESFSQYLIEKRGAKFTTHRILYFFAFFQEIDAFIGDGRHFPSFEQLVNHFSVAHTRKYLSAMQFFESAGLIERSPEIQDLYANFNMIERYLKTFQKGEPFYDAIHNFYHDLEERHTAGRISVRTIRLSLTPAVKFLQYCQLFGVSKPTQTILDGYLWCVPGQRNTLSGFITFYNKTYSTSLVLSTGKKSPKEIVLKSPNVSKKRREQLFIVMMRILKRDADHQHEYTTEKILRITIEYFHDVAIHDDGVMLSFLPIKQRKGEHLIRFAGREFYLPAEIIWIVTKTVISLKS